MQVSAWKIAFKKNKVLNTLFQLKKISAHHYGDSPYSVLKFIYYSFFSINTFILYEINLTGNLRSPDMGPDFKVIKPSVEDLDFYREGHNLPREFYYDQYHNAKNCYIVLIENELAYIHWVYVKGDPNRFLSLGEDCAELNYNTTLPKFRGKGLMSKMMRYILLDLRQQGFARAYGVVNAENHPAVKSMERAGFRMRAKIKAIGPFNHKEYV